MSIRNWYYSSASAPGIFNLSTVNYRDWYWSGWNVEQLDTTASIGHNLTLTLLGSDCPYGGHAGYVYLDGFGNVTPPQTPIPGSILLMGSGLLGLIGIGRRRLS
jgi:hypothetical protein